MSLDFEDSDWPTMPTSDVQLLRIAKQLDAITSKLNDVQVHLSQLAVRHEYIASTIEKDRLYVQGVITNVEQTLERHDGRISKLEGMLLKFSGALIVIIFVGQLAIKRFF